MKRTNPATSIQAYKSLDPKQLNEMYKQIMSALSVLGEAGSEEIAAYLGISKDRVYRRVSELERMLLIYKPGNTRILKSGRKGYTYMLTGDSLPKTEAEQNVYKKGEKAFTDYTREISASSAFSVQNSKQTTLFES